MPCGNYEEMARGLGFDCGKFSDEEKAAFAQAIDDLVNDGMVPEDAIREVMRLNGTEPDETFAVPPDDVIGKWPEERACRDWGEVRICFQHDADAPQEIEIGGFRGVLDPKNGQLHVYNVPLFVACKRGKKDFSRAWMEAALTDAKAGEEDGYLPPMHVLHHGPGGSEVVAAGVFRMDRIAENSFKGEEKPTLFGTLIFTNPGVIGEFMAGRLPYRSIEVMDFSTKKIDSLALLDHEPPFLELPMTANLLGDGEGYTFTVSPSGSNDPMVAFFSRGAESRIVQENVMPSDYKPVVFQKDDEEKPKPGDEANPDVTTPEEIEEHAVEHDEMGAPAEGPEAAAPDMGEPAVDTPEAADMPGEGLPPTPPLDEGPDTSWMEPEADAAGAGPVNTDMIVSAILEGTIAVKDFHAIQQAISQVENAAHMGEEEQMPTDPQAQAHDPKAPPAAAPGEAMKRKITPEEAALMGRVEALEADKQQREEEAAIAEDVTAAMEKLEGRTLGENPRERFTAFRREHGKEAFDAYVNELTAELPPTNFGTRFTASNPEAFDFGKRLPDEVLAFQKDGPEAVEAAAKFAAQYEELKRHGHRSSVSLERFLQINMNGTAAL